MLKITIFKENAVRELFHKVHDNLSIYRTGSFSNLKDSNIFLQTSCELDEVEAQGVKCTRDDDNEVNCCLALFKSLTGISEYLARDERLWVRLTHLEFLEYSRMRWPIPNDDNKAVNHIRKHFFSRGNRGVESDNAISRLWWMSLICSKVKNLPLEECLAILLYQSDVRASIVERPSTSQNPNILASVINKLHESYYGSSLN